MQTDEAASIAEHDGVEPSALPPDALYAMLRGWYRADFNHSERWRREAKEDFEFVAGRQWTDAERNYLTSDEGGKREPITFNRTLAIIKAIAGTEINSRLQIAYLPRSMQPGAIQKNETLTAGSEWMDDTADAPKAQSRAFQDAVKCGMGWVECSLSYDDDADGKYVERRIDPLEMIWDKAAREDNITDARRVFHVRRDIPLAQARRMFPDADPADLDCPWADGSATEAGKGVEEKRRRDENSTYSDSDDTVTLVRCQWWEHEEFVRVVDPMTGQATTLDMAKFSRLQVLIAERGGSIDQVKHVKQVKRVFKQAWLGRCLIGEAHAAPCPSGFSFQCVTGEADEIRGTWYGLTRVVRDPQRWANKWATQIAHILNTTAKGGIIAESDAFEDQRQAEANYAMPDGIVWAAKGAVEKGKIMNKPGAGSIAGYDRMLELALGSIRETSGVNMEIMGLRDANQPGVLEAQRKQAAMTILATMFDSLRRMRKGVGRVRLHYLQAFLADGRLIRITGDDGQMQQVQLSPENVSGDYDTIVEDAPTSPNQKQETWALIVQMLPAIRDKITPDLWGILIEYSPLPSKLVQAVKKSLSAAASDPQQQQRSALAMAGEQASVEKAQASAAKDRAGADKLQIDAVLELIAVATQAQQVRQAANMARMIPNGQLTPEVGAMV